LTVPNGSAPMKPDGRSPRIKVTHSPSKHRRGGG
jgi:hypothetical protein